MRDPYVVLGISLEATEEEIKSAFRELAKKWHPDHNPDNKKLAEERFREIADAYSELSAPQKRPLPHGRPTIRDDLLASFFFSKSAKKTMDVRGGITLTLPEAMIGGRFTISVPSYKLCECCKGTGAQDGNLIVCRACGGVGSMVTYFGSVKCPDCNGSGYVAAMRCIECLGDGDIGTDKTLEVNIPAGIENATVLRLSGFGRVARSKNKLVYGDLMIEVRVAEDPDFTRVGDQLRKTISIPFETALAGGEVWVKNPLGLSAKVVVPRGCPYGYQVAVPGLGVRRKELLVTFRFSLPRLSDNTLTAILKELIPHEVQKDRGS